MIIKGKARTNGSQLAAYLADYLTHEKNERVNVLELRGSAFPDLHRSFCSWEAEAKRGKTQKPLWHAQISPAPNEYLTREQHVEAVNILERHLGLDGQPRAIVFHKNDKGREHIHVVWSRIRREEQMAPDTRGRMRRMKRGSAISDKASNHRNCDAAREIEERFGLRKVGNPEFANQDKTKTRQERRERSKSAPNQQDFQQAKRSGIDPRQVAADVKECWRISDNGKSFRTALFERDYILCFGDRRDYVVVDRAATIHSASRRAGVKVAEMRERLKDLDPASIPRAVQIQSQLRAAWREREDIPPRRRKAEPAPSQQSTASAKPDDADQNRDPLDPTDILAALTANQSTFTKADLDREANKRLQKAHGEEPNKMEISALTSQVRHLPDYIPLGKDRVGRPRFTSREMLETELTMRQLSDQLSAQQHHGVTTQRKTAAPTFAKFTDEQKKAYEHVLTDKGLAAIEGAAGAGKSFLMQAVREAYEAQGFRLRGCAVSSMAARGLMDGSGVESRTLASTLYRIKNADDQLAQVGALDQEIGGITGSSEGAKRRRAKLQAHRDRVAAWADASRLTSRDVVVLDEAGMVGSRQLTELMGLVKKADAKLIMVGDAEQLQAIDAGGAFRAITDRHGSFRIGEIRRQKEQWQKDATKDFFEGYTGDALSVYKKNGHIHQIDSHAEARREIVDAWTRSRRSCPDKTHLMMAYTRHDVHELNQAARLAYKGEGNVALGDRTIATAQGDRQFAEGDRIYFLKNDLRLDVMNGSLGTLQTIDPVKSGDKPYDLRVKLDNGKTVKFSTADYNNFSHGYAATVHKAQGATVDRAFVLASQFMDRHATYVGMSRHRERVDLFFGGDEFKSYPALVGTLSRDRRKDTTLDYLARAENAGNADSFWNRLKRLVVGQRSIPATTAPADPDQPAAKVASDARSSQPGSSSASPPQERSRRPADAMFDRLKARKAERDAGVDRGGTEKLRRILDRFPDRKQTPGEGYGPGI